MPFQSEAQRRYLWANEPEIARDWADTYGSRIEKDDGGITRLNYIHGGITHPDGRRGFPGGSGRKGDTPMGTTSTGGLSSGANYGNTGKDYGPFSKGPPHVHTGPQGSHHKDVGPVKPKVEIKKGSKKISHIQSNEEKRNLVLALRKLGLMEGWNPWDKEIPEWAQNLTEEELMTIATSGPYLSQQKSKWDASQFGEGKDLLG